MTEQVGLWYLQFMSLTWWQMILWVGLLIYFLCRTHEYWYQADEYGVRKGYRRAMFGSGDTIRLYHIVRIILDIPSALIGLFLPFLASTLRFEVYTFKPDTKKTPQEEFDENIKKAGAEDVQGTTRKSPYI